MFILLGLILIETVPGVRDADELRMMSLPESALVEDDIITFFAEFGNGPPIFEVSNTYFNLILLGIYRSMSYY